MPNPTRADMQREIGWDSNFGRLRRKYRLYKRGCPKELLNNSPLGPSTGENYQRMLEYIDQLQTRLVERTAAMHEVRQAVNKFEAQCIEEALSK